MNQTRLGSLIESITNIIIGFGINFTANAFIFPLFGWSISVKQNVTIGIIYTCISIARSYMIRRFFNSKLQKFSKRIAAIVYKKPKIGVSDG